MLKSIKLSSEVHAKLVQRKSEIIAKEGNSISFDKLIERLLK